MSATSQVPCLLHQGDPLVVDQAAVFDRIDPGGHRVLDPLGPVGMRGHFAARGVGFFNGRLSSSTVN